MSKSILSTIIPKPGEAMRGIEGRIGYLLRQANAAHKYRVDNALKGLKVTLPQYSILAFLELYPGISNADLARLSLLTPQTLSVIIINLEKMSVIKRSPHAVHGRIQCIELTAKGKKLLERCTTQVLKVQRELLVGVSEKEEEIIRRWLVSIAIN